MVKLLTLATGVLCLAVSPLRAGDRFAQIKDDLEKAPCAYFAFLSLLESHVFEQVDSARGTAYVSRDGRYFVTIGSDEYLFDSRLLYSYSPENNQVTVETVEEGSPVSEELSFITRLDDYYKTGILVADQQYRLRKKVKNAENLPDSLLVFIDADSLKIASIEYYDVNDELNRIIITEQRTLPECDTARFQPDFPDSAEVIRLW